MQSTTLMVMAAGLGARYGGNKQMDGMGPNGEILMEYSIHDALEAGFDKVIFILRRDAAEIFHQRAGKRIAKKAEVAYAFQEYDSLPGGFVPPQGRTKPYGTVHAVTCAKALVREPFAVINADDYYGKSAFAAMRGALCALPPRNRALMAGYKLRNTVSENGYVTRGVCTVDPSGRLLGVKETYRIALCADGTIRDTENDAVLNPQSLVSMNFWGFSPWIFEAGEECLADFLGSLAPDELKKEYPLPVMADQLMRKGELAVEVLSTESSWFGVTYQEDKAKVEEALKALHDAGAYPKRLFE